MDHNHFVVLLRHVLSCLRSLLLTLVNKWDKVSMAFGQHDPPSDSANAKSSPAHVFAVRKVNNSHGSPMNRFCIRRRFVPAVLSLKTTCIYTDGLCLNNGSVTTTPRGGFAFVFKDGDSGKVGRPLENKGVDGKTYPHTNNQAELRTVLSALTYRVWWGEGWERIVIITDSEYVAAPATSSLRTWVQKDWRVSSGKPAANKDLWQELSQVMGTFANAGCEISFWKVPRSWNAEADLAAKTAANQGGANDEYTTPAGYLV